MKKLYFLLTAGFGRPEQLNQNNSANQFCFLNKQEALINNVLLESNTFIKKEIRLMIEDKIVINNAVEKYYPVHKSRRVFIILISLFFCLIFFYCISLAVKKYVLKREKAKTAKQLHTIFSAKEQKETSQIKLQEEKKYFLCKKDNEFFFSYNGLSSDNDCFLNKLFGYPAFKKCSIPIIKNQGVDRFGEKVIEIDYKKILQKIKNHNLCLVFNTMVCFFQEEKFQQINLSEFDQKKEKIKKLNSFFINKEIFKVFIDFFSNKISVSIEKTLLKNITNIEELIFETLEKFPTIEMLSSCEVKYRFIGLHLDQLTTFFVYKEEKTSFFDYLHSFFFWFFWYIHNIHGKWCFIKKKDQNDEEILAQDIENMIDKVKDLFFLKEFMKTNTIYTVLGSLEVSKEKYKTNIETQEKKIRKYLAEKYFEKGSYYLSWEEIIDFLEKCLLDKSCLSEEEKRLVF